MQSNQTSLHDDQFERWERLRLERKERREEIEAYQDALNKLSNEEKEIINAIEVKIRKAKMEEMMIWRNFQMEREKERIKNLKNYEDNQRKIHNANMIGRGTFCIGAIAYVGLTILK